MLLLLWVLLVCTPAHPKNQTQDLTSGKGRECLPCCGNHPGASWRQAEAQCYCSLGWPCQGGSSSAVLSPSLVPSMVVVAVPACFASSACNELPLAPGWLFANVNLLQTLLLITLCCRIPLGAVA